MNVSISEIAWWVAMPSSERAMRLSFPVSRYGVVIVSIVAIVTIIALVMWLPY